jgi:hypothetical protein
MVTLSRQKQRSTISKYTVIAAICVVMLLAVLHVVTSDDDDSISKLLLAQSEYISLANANEAAANGPPLVHPKVHALHRHTTQPTLPFATDLLLSPEPSTTSTATASPKATIAYAWTLAKCSDFQSSTEGMIDAALILKHSIHKVSSRVGKSNYDYQMYVLVHQAAAACTQALEDAGYTVKILPQPVDKKDIRGVHLRKTVDREVRVLQPKAFVLIVVLVLSCAIYAVYSLLTSINSGAADQKNSSNSTPTLSLSTQLSFTWTLTLRFFDQWMNCSTPFLTVLAGMRLSHNILSEIGRPILKHSLLGIISK